MNHQPIPSVVHDPHGVLAGYFASANPHLQQPRAAQQPARRPASTPARPNHSVNSRGQAVSADGQTASMFPEDVAITAEDEELYDRMFGPGAPDQLSADDEALWNRLFPTTDTKES